MSTKKAKRKRATAQPMIVLASNCSVKDAAELKQSLCLHLEQASPVTLDVGSVERVDTSTVQVLCAFVRDRSAQQRKVEWLGDSSVVREAARLLGVEPLLCLPQAEVTR
jgi:ABC-type transporter Mla MlaB component